MLLELSVQNLGVIESSSLVLGPGVSVLTGETGAGKTMVVQAIQLLTGGKADPSMVRSGAKEATIEGRFETPDGEELILRRVIPAEGRSRAYLNNALASASQLADTGSILVDLHGQHQHQSLLQAKVQRLALDNYAQIDLTPLNDARSAIRQLLDQLDQMGGDTKARAREIDLLQFQIAELTQAQLVDPSEPETLEELEEVLADASEHIEQGSRALENINGDNGLIDTLGAILASLADRAPYRDVTERLRSLEAELSDVGAAMRDKVDSIEDDPQRLSEVRERRQLLLDLQRKYGDTIGDVIKYHLEGVQRLEDLENHEAVAAKLEIELTTARGHLAQEAKKVAELRRQSAPQFADEVSQYLPALALDHASVSVIVDGDDPADEIEIMFRANSGTNWHALSKVASGGELARVMLALRLVLTAGPPTLVFDEVDAGIGGAAALAVGQALSRLGADHQVLVVTHLPQVAAFGDQHLVVDKFDDGSRVVSTVHEVDGDIRIRELARMLAGQPDSETGQDHAAELLQEALKSRG
mgnify:FL=1|tara:strand:- start:9433 stop:11022 length:1590 start_codon:yes stop_codon:yes gene_type:complete